MEEIQMACCISITSGRTRSAYAGSLASMAQGLVIVLYFLLLCSPVITAVSDHMDATALISLKKNWSGTLLTWKGTDPCGDQWEGIKCQENRVVSILLSTIGLEGKLTDDINALSELQTLDISYNRGLEGPLPRSIGKLSKLETLVLVGCSLSGVIPDEIGLLRGLVYLSLNSNNFDGSIPPSIGNLTNLYWLDLADNSLTGKIPVSSGSTPGLDLLTKTKHFHLGNNQLTGEIPSQLLSSNMALIHLLLDGNKLTGSIPSTLGSVKSLKALRLDGNSLNGTIPSNFNNLIAVNELHLSNNKLTGSIPDLSGLQELNYLDLSNNSFDMAEMPSWFSTLKSITSLKMDSTNLQGQLPQALLTLPKLQLLSLRRNQINGTLNIPIHFINQQLTVDLQDNYIDHFVGEENGIKIVLVGNPVCDESRATFSYCQLPQTSGPLYTSKPGNCSSIICPSDQKQSPKCRCSIPYTGRLFFSSPSFSDFNNSTHYHVLEGYLMETFKLNLPSVDSVALDNLQINANGFLKINLEIFRVENVFNRSEVSKIDLTLSNQNFKPPTEFGPFSFTGDTYNALGGEGNFRSSVSKGVIAGAATVGGCLILLVVITIWLYAFRQKREAKVKTRVQCKISDSTVLHLKEARWYSLNALKASTDNFSEACEIGHGGYGKVYKGVLPSGQVIAIKRSQEGSKQGRHEFNTEIELLSRLHHKNLVTLVGFCFENGEHTLVYDYISNGNLKDSLSGKSGIQLDWKTRVRIALGAARGLAYLHELADPPIIHRDIKSGNILLDEHLNAKVSDFGLSKPIVRSEKVHVTTQVKGTLGYLDPKYYMTHQLSKRSDVYSFGVLLLEIITARAPIEQGIHIVTRVAPKMDKEKDLYGLDELLDPVLGLTSRPGGLDKYVDLAMSCVEESADADRPTMSMVAKELESIAQLAGVDIDTGISRCDPCVDPLGSESSYVDGNGYSLSEIKPR